MILKHATENTSTKREWPQGCCIILWLCGCRNGTSVNAWFTGCQVNRPNARKYSNLLGEYPPNLTQKWRYTFTFKGVLLCRFLIILKFNKMNNDITILLSYMIAKETVQPSPDDSLNKVLNELSDGSIWNLIEAPTSSSVLKNTCKSILRSRILATSN